MFYLFCCQFIVVMIFVKCMSIKRTGLLVLLTLTLMEMTFFHNIRTNHGQGAVTAVRSVSKTLNKLASCENNKFFLVKCREFKLTPKFMQGSRNCWDHVSTINRKTLTQIKSQYDKKVIGILIRDACSKVWKLKSTLDENIVNLLQKIPPPLVDNIIASEMQKYDKIVITLKSRSEKKLKALIATADAQVECKTPQLNEVWKKWVVNLSGKTVPESVLKVLALGPKFSYQKDKRKQGKGTTKLAEEFCVDTMIANLESKLKYESEALKKEVRAKTVNILGNFLANVNSGRINNHHREVMSHEAEVFVRDLGKNIQETRKFLSTNKDIYIIEADKSSKTVIITEEMYDSKMASLLNDKKVYRKIKRDLTNTQQLKNNTMINNWFKNKYIEERTRDWLITKDAVAPKIYGLLKTHKPDMPVRPIVSCVRSPFYKMSLFLVGILAEIVGKNKYHIRDSFHFREYVKHQKVPSGYILASFDVESLYTNIPIDLALKVIDENWKKIEKLTKLPKKEFLYAIEVCLRSTFFQFKDGFFDQVEGLAMGAPVSACIANLVLEHAQEKILAKCKGKVLFFKRFVDDCFLCFRPEDQNEILNLFNAFHPALRFTSEVEVDGAINFMDLTVFHKDTKITTKWYQKPTHSGRYLNYLSDVPFHQKLNVVKNLFHRVVKLTDKCYLNESIQRAEQLLFENAYPTRLIKNLGRKFKYCNANKSVGKNFDVNKIVKLPFVPGLSEKLKHNFQSAGFETVFQNRFNNKHLFTRLKSKDPIEKTSNVVYKLQCNNCEGSYIGQTKRYLKERIRSHVYDKKEQTALKKHCNESGHSFDFKNPKILVRESNTQARLFHEAIQIKKDFAPVNSRADVQCLSAIYDPLLIGSRTM